MSPPGPGGRGQGRGGGGGGAGGAAAGAGPGNDDDDDDDHDHDDDVQGPVHLAVKPTVDQVQDLIDAVVDNVTGEYNNSAIPVLLDTVSTIQDPASPLHFLLQIIPQPIVALLPQQARTGPVGALWGPSSS